MRDTLWLFDVDGTVIDSAQRGAHEIERIDEDVPMPWTRGLWDAGAFKHGPHGFLTARSHLYRHKTSETLCRHDLARPNTLLVMRTNILERAVDFKTREILALLSARSDQHIIYFEDQPDIISRLRGLGHSRLFVVDAEQPDLLDTIEYLCS